MKRKNKREEQSIERDILAYLNYRFNCFAFKVDTHARFDPRLGFFLKLNKLILPGTPDILCCYSVQGSGRFVAFEVKTEKGCQSQEQKEFETKLGLVNGFYFVVRSIKDAELALEEVTNKLTTA